MSITFWRTAGLLVISNTFMTFAWYAQGGVVHFSAQFSSCFARMASPERAVLKLLFVS